MFAGRIAGIALFGSELALTANAPLQLRLNFGAASLLHRISATGNEQSDGDDEEERRAFHPLILETKRTKANRQDERDFNRSKSKTILEQILFNHVNPV